MSKITAAVLTLVAAGLVAMNSAQAGPHEKINLKGVKCMLCGMQVSEQHAIEYKGAKLFFGCAGCPPRFAKDVEKYAAKANSQLVATKQAVQKACPITGKTMKKAVKMKVVGTTVYFCCSKCKTDVGQLKSDEQVESVFGKKAHPTAFQIATHSK